MHSGSPNQKGSSKAASNDFPSTTIIPALHGLRSGITLAYFGQVLTRGGKGMNVAFLLLKLVYGVALRLFLILPKIYISYTQRENTKSRSHHGQPQTKLRAQLSIHNTKRIFCVTLGLCLMACIKRSLVARRQQFIEGFSIFRDQHCVTQVRDSSFEF